MTLLTHPVGPDPALAPPEETGRTFARRQIRQAKWRVSFKQSWHKTSLSVRVSDGLNWISFAGDAFEKKAVKMGHPHSPYLLIVQLL